MSILVNHSLENRIKTKDDIIQNQQQTVMELVADKVKNQLTQEDEDIKRLIKDLR
jgi:FtsZ-binding cell division protein ZapB